tara:strand:- start:304 stop:477 length:174 start_codon:yes stop_codon:yes gene_type:complete
MADMYPQCAARSTPGLGHGQQERRTGGEKHKDGRHAPALAGRRRGDGAEDEGADLFP